MDPHTAQVIFQVLMARLPEYMSIMAQEIANVLHQDRVAKMGYQQALQQAGLLFVQSLFRADLTAENAFQPLMFALPDDESDAIHIQTFAFSKRHFATNVHRYAADVERYYREQYKALDVARVTVMVTDTGVTVTLFKQE